MFDLNKKKKNLFKKYIENFNFKNENNFIIENSLLMILLEKYSIHFFL
jgi:hypothetical protein